jgi:hypothetical protein
MDDRQTNEAAPEAWQDDHGFDDNSDESQVLTGMEISVGDFTRTHGLMKALRLVIESQIVVQVEEIAAGVSDAGRKFKMGDIEQANQDVARLYAAFSQKTSQWESQARNAEQQLKAHAVKNPKSISMNRINQLKAEQTAVRGRIRTADIQFRRLHQGLEVAYTNSQRQPAGATSDTAIPLPPGFLEKFQAATPVERPEIVQEFFATESVLQVKVSRGATSGYNIKFSPTPPLGRLYFSTETAQLLCLQQLSRIVVVRDVATGETHEMKVVKFVRMVQSGVWLLEPRFANQEPSA